jgi:hypothetical protein
MMDGPIADVSIAVNHMMDGPIARDQIGLWLSSETLQHTSFHQSVTIQMLGLEDSWNPFEKSDWNPLQHLDWKVTTKVHLSPSMKLYHEITLEIQIT